GYFVNNTPSSRPVKKQFIVEVNNPKMIPLNISQGEYLDLRVEVLSGNPVNIEFAQQGTPEDKNAVNKNQGLIGAELIRNYHQRQQWPHAKPAIIIISSQGKSEVKLEAYPATSP
ncbi:MAG: hypothetical protein AB7P49_20625, partial [Bdellovibrionales bacterium]